MSLEKNDIQRLVREPSAAARASIATKLSQDFNQSSFTLRETQLAVDIFRLLLRDTAVQVRQAIADNLKNCPHAPHDVIMALANDVNEVALGILEFSTVLTAEDLASLVKASQDVERWVAISRRENLETEVCHALVKTNHQKVVGSLLENTTAQMSGDDLEDVLYAYRGNQTIMEALVCRGGLSPQLAAKVYDLVAERLKRYLSKKFMLSWNLAKDTTNVARDVSIIKFLIPHLSPNELYDLVGQMYRNKRLNYGIILRGLCAGEVRFFEIAMAHLANIPVVNARSVMLDTHKNDYETIFNASLIPSGFSEALRVIYRTAYVLTEKGTQRIPGFAGHMIDLLQANGYHESVENMSYFLSILKQQHYGNRTLH